jgi:hypothetical protein
VGARGIERGCNICQEENEDLFAMANPFFNVDNVDKGRIKDDPAARSVCRKP